VATDGIREGEGGRLFHEIAWRRGGASRTNSPADEQVASTEAKQSSRGRGTTEYENRLALRGAGGQSIRLQPHTSNACRFFTCRIPMAGLEP